MTGVEALTLLKHGHKITCKSWKNKSWFLVAHSDGSKYTFSVKMWQEEILIEFLNDILDGDWEVVE
jgi:hypothetical protein